MNILLIDDHPLVRDGIRSILKNLKDLNIVGEAENGEDGLKYAEVLNPDLIILDLSLPDIDGFEILEKLMAKESVPKILVLSSFEKQQYIFRALDFDIDAYVVKRAAGKELIDALKKISQGDKYFSPIVMEYVMNRYTSQKKMDNEHEELTDREKEILKHIVKGLSSPKIADELHISERTVHTHRNNIMKKLKVNNTVQLVKLALMNDNLYL